MPNDMDVQSLVKTAAQLGISTRGETATTRDARANSSANARGGNFGGFLNSFLGGAKSPSSGKSAKAKSAKSNSSKDKGIWLGVDKPSQAEKAKSARKAQSADAARRQERDDLEEEADAEREIEEVAEAAEEAARLLWNILYGDDLPGDADADAAEGGSYLKRLSDALGGGQSAALAGLNGNSIDANAMQAAMETANASAEMNQSAVLSALDDMVDGLPRTVLEKALAGDGKSLDQLAAALNARLTGVESASPLVDANKLLAELELAAAAAARQNAGAGAENSAGSLADAEGGEDGLEEILGISDDGESADPGESAGKAGGSVKSKEARGAFPGAASTLEDGLQSNAFRNALTAADTAVGGSDPGAPAQAQAGQVGNGGQVQPAGSDARAAQSERAPGSAMAEQIENLERIAEVVKLGSRRGPQNLTLQLTPAELGKVTLRVETRDGAVSAFLRVEKPEAAAQLSHNLQQLRENLKAQGIELRTLEIRQQQNELAAGDWSGQHQGRNGNAGFTDDARFSSRSGGRGDENDTNEEAATAVAAETGRGQSGLNLFA